MTIEILDTRGLKTPQHILKLIVKSVEIKSGGILKVIGDCPTFEKDVRAWCQGTGRVVLSVESEGENNKIIRIQF